MKNMKHLLALLLALAMLVPAFAEEEEDDWSFIEMSGEMIFSYDNVDWNFPVDITDARRRSSPAP